MYFGGLQKYQKLPAEAGTKKKSIPTPVLQFSNFQNACCSILHNNFFLTSLLFN